MASSLEDYALIGDGATAALVARDGSLDWLCWPRFDNAACFAALVGAPDHGRWLLAAADVRARRSRRYRDCTLILETVIESADGAATVVDFMPPRGETSNVVRLVCGQRGQLALRTELVLRFDYGSLLPWLTRLDDGCWRAVSGPDSAVLRTPAPLHADHRTIAGEFTVSAGQIVPFVLTYGASHLAPPEAIDPIKALTETEAFWRGWASEAKPARQWSDPVRRSLITLKALTHVPTGGIIAAPTTSLPERLGGKRNWDYRFCWLRDATFTLIALMNAGYYEDAQAWRNWLLRAVAGDPARVQIMYGVTGEHRLPEWEVPWLDGYHGAKPVRVGNAGSSNCRSMSMARSWMLCTTAGTASSVPAKKAGIATRVAGPSRNDLGQARSRHLGGAGDQQHSPIPRSWPGSLSIAPSRPLSISSWRVRSRAGENCAGPFTTTSAATVSIQSSARSRRATDRSNWTPAHC